MPSDRPNYYSTRNYTGRAEHVASRARCAVTRITILTRTTIPHASLAGEETRVIRRLKGSSTRSPIAPLRIYCTKHGRGEMQHHASGQECVWCSFAENPGNSRSGSAVVELFPLLDVTATGNSVLAAPAIGRIARLKQGRSQNRHSNQIDANI
jgi:hypothetical protein